MKGFINDLWWMFLLHGIALILFGLVAVVWPGLTLTVLASAFAIYILISGVMNLLIGIGSVKYWQGWFLPILLGIIEVATGVYILKTTGLVLAVFITTVGFIFIAQGILNIVDAMVNLKDFGLKLFGILTGILGLLAGFIVLRNPVVGGLSFAWVLGVYGLVGGTIIVAKALSWRFVVDDIVKDFSKLKVAAR